MNFSNSNLANDTLLRALRTEPTDYTPIWLMRQAGRYLPEYRAMRERAGSFLALLKNPEDATEVTLQPLNRYPLDAVILFSDILTVPDAMGLGLTFVAGEGPRFAQPIRTEAQIEKIENLDLTLHSISSRLDYVMQTIIQVKRALIDTHQRQRVPLIGFSGSPFTLACYMIEGGRSADFCTVKSMLYRRPDLLHRLLEINTHAIAAYLNAQINAGVQVVMIFDTWGGVLADGAFQRFSLAYIAKVIEQLPQLPREGDKARSPVPVIVFTKGGGQWLEAMAQTGGMDAIGLDWTTNLGDARARLDRHKHRHSQGHLGKSIALQGNLDPTVLLAPPEVIRAEVRTVLDHYGAHPGHVFNLGHGVLPNTPPEHVAVMVDEVHGYSRLLRSK